MVSNSTLEKLIWLLIYGGLLVLCLAFFLQRSGASWGWLLMALGGAAVLSGVIGVWLRSRRSR